MNDGTRPRLAGQLDAGQCILDLDAIIEVCEQASREQNILGLANAARPARVGTEIDAVPVIVSILHPLNKL